jgi:hypothetical protein
VSMGLTLGPTDQSARHSEAYLDEFPYLGTPHSGFAAHVQAS